MPLGGESAGHLGDTHQSGGFVFLGWSFKCREVRALAHFSWSLDFWDKNGVSNRLLLCLAPARWIQPMRLARELQAQRLRQLESCLCCLIFGVISTSRFRGCISRSFVGLRFILSGVLPRRPAWVSLKTTAELTNVHGE